MVDEPKNPEGTKPHRERLREIDRLLPEGRTGAICIDNLQNYKDWYLQELKKYPRLVIESQAELSEDIYLIKVRKVSHQ